MFDLGWSELLLVAVLALIFVGPKDLPKLMHTIGRYVGKIRAMAQDFQKSFDDMARETELDELRKEVQSLRGEVMRPLESSEPQDPPKIEPINTEGLPDEMVAAIREAEAIEAEPDPVPRKTDRLDT